MLAGTVSMIANNELPPGHILRDGVAVTAWESVAYDEICAAVEQNLPCPLNLDIEMLIGCNSGSVASTLVARLEAKGLIRVRRFQRFREVQIVATGKWTARNPAMQIPSPRVPRGLRRVVGTCIEVEGCTYRVSGSGKLRGKGKEPS